MPSRWFIFWMALFIVDSLNGGGWAWWWLLAAAFTEEPGGEELLARLRNGFMEGYRRGRTGREQDG